MANHHTRGPFVSLLSHPDSEPVTVRQQGSVVCQHLPADKDREGRILSPGEHSAECVFEGESVCEETQSEYLCVFSQ